MPAAILARLVLLEARRGGLPWLAGASIALGLLLGAFLSQLAVTESRMLQAAIVAALLRACAMFLIATQVASSTWREINDKGLELMLSLPLSRTSQYFGRLAGFAACGIALAALFALPLLLWASPGLVALWALSLACEAALVAALSLFFAMTLSQLVPALAASAGLYLLARSITAIQAIASDLPPPPPPQALQLASFGEPAAAARLAMLYLQAFDLGGTNAIPYQRLDYERLARWLGAILALDPRSQYPLFCAARIYAETADASRSRIMLEFIYREFFADPNRRWPWLAHAALLAKHRLGDLPLARRYATAIDRYTTSADIPLWAKQMEIFILEDMNELEAARIMLGGLLASGAIRDPAELRFLKQRLEDLERRLR